MTNSGVYANKIAKTKMSQGLKLKKVTTLFPSAELTPLRYQNNGA